MKITILGAGAMGSLFGGLLPARTARHKRFSRAWQPH
jgi:ketopantoate reductase